jgi:hypothetical protein
MATKPIVNSQLYRCGYPIRNEHEFPSDFHPDLRHGRFSFGIFLPGCSMRFGQAPPHILVLLSNAIVFASHPSEEEGQHTILYEDLISVQAGKFLLDCSIRFVTAGYDFELFHNGRDSRLVDDFVSRLEERVFPPLLPSEFPTATLRGKLNYKFTQAEARELFPGEIIVSRLFCGPSGDAANYVAITNRRLLWITDRSGMERDPFGVYVRSTGLTRLFGISLSTGQEGHFLRINLFPSTTWNVPVPALSLFQAREFVKDARKARDLIGIPPIID